MNKSHIAHFILGFIVFPFYLFYHIFIPNFAQEISIISTLIVIVTIELTQAEMTSFKEHFSLLDTYLDILVALIPIMIFSLLI